MRANRGEWSELYVLIKLLVEKKLYAAEENLESIKDLYYPVSQITTAALSSNKIIYDITNEDEIIIIHPETNSSATIKRSVIKDKIIEFYQSIARGGESRAFPIPEGDIIMDLLERKQISATSGQQADLVLEIFDPKFLRSVEQGYSIKSKIGSASTLFNSSSHTNLIYKLQSIDKGQLETINKEGSCRLRVRKIYDMGGQLEFVKTESESFLYNLIQVDSNFPQIIAQAVILYFRYGKPKLTDMVNILTAENLNFSGFSPNDDFYRSNFKKFLFNSALGMVAGKKWNNEAASAGGIIIVKKNGDIVGYNPYNFNRFQEFLFDNTKFDAPDTRLKYGTAYMENEDLFIKLNFQIRFIR